MKIKITKEIMEKDYDLLIYFLSSEALQIEKLPQGTFLAKLLQKNTKLTEKEKVTTCFCEIAGTIKKVVIVGLGEQKSLCSNTWRRAAGMAARFCYSEKQQKALVCAPDLQTTTEISALTEGLYLGAYKFSSCKSKKAISNQVNFSLVAKLPHGTQAVNAGLILAKNIALVRDLVNQPGNLLYPEVLGNFAKQLAAKASLSCEVLTKKELEKKKMGGLLAVGKGSKSEPRLITLKYQGAGKNKPFLAFVGKGITFDSGGISLKPSANMDEMKDDMSGAAVVIGAIKTLAELKIPVNVLAIAACAENMPGGNATRPGDVVVTASGKTIEIINTDAEGRVALSDAVWYACELGAEKVIDVATLTGACIIALGNNTAGIITNDDTFSQTIINAGKRAGEAYWQLPALEDIKELLKGDTGDLKNETGRAGGTISAGLFIGEFIKKGVKWAHLDIAGTAYLAKEDGYKTKGATGFALATLVEVAKEYK